MPLDAYRALTALDRYALSVLSSGARPNPGSAAQRLRARRLRPPRTAPFDLGMNDVAASSREVAAMFRDRVDAGRQLADALAAFADEPSAIVLGVPRGGVVVAAEVARALRLPLDVVVTSKVGAPGNPEYAIGAVAPDGVVSPNDRSGYSARDVASLAEPVQAKIARRLEAFRGGRPEPDLHNRTVIVVDDGIATGLTARAAVEYLRRRGAKHIVLAAPVMPPDSARMLRAVADDVIALDTPGSFWAVGQFYQIFGQTQDDEVVRLLDEARRRAAAPGESGPEARRPAQ